MKKQIIMLRFFTGLIILFFCVQLPTALMAKDPDEEVHETVKIWMLYKLKTELGLDQNQCLAVFELIDNLEQAKRDYFKFERTVLRELATMIESGNQVPDSYNDLLIKIDDRQNMLRAVELKTAQDVKKLLDPIQRAKLLVLRKDLKQKIQHIIQTLERKENRRAARPQGPRFEPDQMHQPDDDQF